MKSVLTQNLKVKSASLDKLRTRTHATEGLNYPTPLKNKPAKAVFLDKDGTLIEDVPYNVNLDRIRLSYGAIGGLQQLHAANYKIFIVTNQSGVARGFFPESALADVEQHLRQLLEAAEVPLAGFYYCPHHPEGILPSYSVSCTCRKPQAGMLLRAASDHGISLEQSWFVGDILNDIEAGRRAGCRTVLINNGNETKWELNYRRMPHHIVPDLSDAARVITTLDSASLFHPLGYAAANHPSVAENS